MGISSIHKCIRHGKHDSLVFRPGNRKHAGEQDVFNYSLMDSILLPTAYFPPVSWFALCYATPDPLIEMHEHFPKQTWRNRCTVASVDGLHHLVVPLSGRRDKTLVKDIRIDYAFTWQKTHWKTLEACYRKSPWFEFYEDQLVMLFSMKEKYLVDHNEKILDKLFVLLGETKLLKRATSYESDGSFMDARGLFSKKNLNAHCSIPEYANGSERGMSGNLSILDLLFYEGKMTREILGKVSLKPGT